MVNPNRIVPITKIDFLSMIATILTMMGEAVLILQPNDIDGNFVLNADGDYVANQPVKSLDFAAGASDDSVYFCADYDFQGISLAGVAVDASAVKPDGISLYKATLSNGAVTIEAMTLSLG